MPTAGPTLTGKYAVKRFPALPRLSRAVMVVSLPLLYLGANNGGTVVHTQTVSATGDTTYACAVAAMGSGVKCPN